MSKTNDTILTELRRKILKQIVTLGLIPDESVKNSAVISLLSAIMLDLDEVEVSPDHNLFDDGDYNSSWVGNAQLRRSLEAREGVIASQNQTLDKVVEFIQKRDELLNQLAACRIDLTGLYMSAGLFDLPHLVELAKKFDNLNTNGVVSGCPES